MTTKINCISCNQECYTGELDSDGICDECNNDDLCLICGIHELDCDCTPMYGFSDDTFDEDDIHDELLDWEGDDY